VEDPESSRNRYRTFILGRWPHRRLIGLLARVYLERWPSVELLSRLFNLPALSLHAGRNCTRWFIDNGGFAFWVFRQPALFLVDFGARVIQVFCWSW